MPFSLTRISQVTSKSFPGITSVVISSLILTKDASYTLYSKGTSTGKQSDGLYADGNYQDGMKVVEFKISDSVTWLDESGITEAKSSGPRGMGGPGGGKCRKGKETQGICFQIWMRRREKKFKASWSNNEMVPLPGKKPKNSWQSWSGASSKRSASRTK